MKLIEKILSDFSEENIDRIYKEVTTRYTAWSLLNKKYDIIYSIYTNVFNNVKLEEFDIFSIEEKRLLIERFEILSKLKKEQEQKLTEIKKNNLIKKVLEA